MTLQAPRSDRRLSGPILVTGATGFVGSNLARRLVLTDAEVHVLARPLASTHRVADINGRLRVHHADLREPAAVLGVLESVQPRVVFHCGAMLAGRMTRPAPELYATNLLGTVNLLDAASKVGVETFVNTGSFYEYGNTPVAVSEDDPCEPVDPYGLSKLAATLHGQMLARAEGLSVVTLRLFHVFGPFEAAHRLIPAVIKAALGKGELPLTSGTQVRDFVFVDDVVDAYLSAATAGGLAGEVINVGSGTGRSVREVVETLLMLLRSTVVPLWGRLPDPELEVRICVADRTKACRLLGWSPRHDLREGLQRTIAWFTARMAEAE